MKRAQKAVGRDRPGRQQRLVRCETLGVELIEWRQEEQEQHQKRFVSGQIETRDGVDCEQGEGRVQHREQVE